MIGFNEASSKCKWTEHFKNVFHYCWFISLYITRIVLFLRQTFRKNVESFIIILDSSRIERSEPSGLSWELKLAECSGASLLRTGLVQLSHTQTVIIEIET